MSGSILNISIKLIAVFLAVLLWFNVITKKQYEHELTLPITEVEFPVGLGPVGQLPDSLTVRVLAAGKKLLRGGWKADGLRLKAGLLRRGMVSLGLNLETVALVRSEEVSLIDIVGAQSLSLRLDRIDSTLKPIASRLAVVPAEGYMIVEGSGSVNPLSTQVIGPALLLGKIDSIYTEQKIIDNVDDSITRVLDLEVPHGQAITLGHDSAQVAINVDKKISRKFDDISVTFRGNLRGYRTIVDPERVSIEIEGPRAMVNALIPAHIHALVSYDGTMRTGYVVPEVPLAPNLKLTNITPDSVRILVSP